MFRVALISRWHVHAEQRDSRYVKDLLSNPECKVTCVYDKDPVVAKEWAEEYDVPYFTDLEEILSYEEVDGVLVTSNANDHKEILIAAANHKKHIFTEKVLSFTLEDAYAIRDAIKKNNVKFCISFMRLAIPQLAYAKKLIEDGTIGEPCIFRCVCGHAGGLNGDLPEYWYDPEICGGGAMIDLGFNSTYLARYILGEMESVSSSFYNVVLDKRVEDNASCNVKFKNGAMGILDATFTSPLMSVFELSVCGTKGAYFARFGGNDIAQLRVDGQTTNIPLNELPNEIKTPVQTWVDAVMGKGSDELYGIDAAVDMVKFMNAAYQSAKESGKRVMI